jgi:hypothetical protein
MDRATSVIAGFPQLLYCARNTKRELELCAAVHMQQHYLLSRTRDSVPP